MSGLIPHKFKYVSTYTFMQGPSFAMEKQEGQAKIHFDGFSPKKVFTVEFIPTGGVQGKVDLTIHPTNPGFTYKFEITQGGKSYFKQESTQVVTANNANKWEATQTTKSFMAQDSPIYKLHCKYVAYPLPCSTTHEETQKIFWDKKNKNYFLNKFSVESITTFGGKIFSIFKMDTTKTPFTYIWDVPQAPSFYPFEDKIVLDGKLTHEYKFNTVNSPYVFTINQVVAPQWYPIEGQFDLTFEPKNNLGFHMIYKLVHGAKTYMTGDHDVTVVNNGNKFEINELSKQTMDEHTMVYAMHCKLAYPLPCPKQIDVVRKVFVDKKNKNFLFNKMTYDTEVKLDGQVYKN